MKTVLVATDFSDASKNASIYAGELASAFNARVILLNAYQQMPVPVAESPVIIRSADIKPITERLLKQEAARIYSGKTIALETQCKPGFAKDVILDTAREMKVDLIVAGMKAEAKGFKKLFGSTVSSLAKKTNVPLIVVPENTKYTPLNAIAIAIDSDLPPETDHQLFYSLRYLAERFDSYVYIVRVFAHRSGKTDEGSARPLKLEKMIRTVNPRYERIDGNNVVDTLNKFVEDHKIRLLVILPHHHNLLERIFTQSTTSEMIFRTYVPLLILPQP